MPLDEKQSSPLISDAALRLPGAPPDLPSDVIERFPSLRSWADAQNRFWRGAANGIEEMARAAMDVLEVGGVLNVDPNAGSLYIRRVKGQGFFRDADTPFFVNKAGQFSLGAKLFWEPETSVLTVSGTIFANAGEIGGFVIGTDYLRDAANSFGLASTVTGADDVRFFAGAAFAARATAPFRVYESGAIVATSGTIGGFNLGTDYLRDVANTFGLASTVTGADDIRVWAGETFANRATAPFRVTEGGALTATSGSIGGFNIGADYIRDVGNMFGLASTVTGGNDVRVWIGATFANRATAPLRFYEDGTGVIAGFTIGATTLSAGTGDNRVVLDSGGGSSGLIFGTPGGYISGYGNSGWTTGNSVGFTVVTSFLSGDAGVITVADSGGITRITLAGASGIITATSFAGSGASLTGLTKGQVGLSNVANVDTTNASNISSGTLPDARLSYSATPTGDVLITGYTTIGGAKCATVA